MSLYLKHRPKRLAMVIGNQETVSTLSSFSEKNKMPHAILLTGPTGCGKTTIGRIIAKEVGADPFDIKEIDTADFRNVDTVRTIRDQMQYKPMKGKAKVWILDEVHQLGTGGSSKKNIAQSALLKALEDTPPHVYFILCTTNPEMLLPTIRGRCATFEMEKLNEEDMEKLIARVARKEKTEIPKEVVSQIIESGDGHPRNTLQILDKVIQLPEKQMLKVARQKLDIKNEAIELCRLLLKRPKWKEVAAMLKGLKEQNAEGIRRAVLGYMTTVMINGNGSDFHIMEAFEDDTFTTEFAGIVMACFRAVHNEDVPF